MDIKFKLQGNGVKSWIVDGNLIYESPTNKMHNQMLSEILTEHNYLTIGELYLWVNDEKYGEEAQSIIDWWITTCKLVEDYLFNNEKEETAFDFINGLPKLNNI